MRRRGLAGLAIVIGLCASACEPAAPAQTPRSTAASGERVSSATTPAELQFLFNGDADQAEWYREHDHLLRSAYAELARGHAWEALTLFRAAGRVPFFEDFNTRAWVGEAEAHCRLGDRDRGREALAEFRCALDLEYGRRACSTLETSFLEPRGGEDFPTRCYEEICAGELVRALLPRADELVSAEERRHEAGLRRLADRVEAVCAGPAPRSPPAR
jgi:hypothetical protein